MPDAGEAKTALSGGAGGGGGGYPSKRLRSPERTRCRGPDCHAGDQAWELRAKGENTITHIPGRRPATMSRQSTRRVRRSDAWRLLKGGESGQTTFGHPANFAVRATNAHRKHQQQHTRRLLTSCARAGVLTSNSTFGDFAEGGKVDDPHSASRRILPSVRRPHTGNDNNNTRCE